MAMPSVTVMVQNSRGVPPASSTPFLADWAWRISAMLQGAASFQALTHADERAMDLLLGEAHRVVVGAMRRARRALRHVAARQLALVELPRGHHSPVPFPLLRMRSTASVRAGQTVHAHAWHADVQPGHATARVTGD